MNQTEDKGSVSVNKYPTTCDICHQTVQEGELIFIQTPAGSRRKFRAHPECKGIATK